MNPSNRVVIPHSTVLLLRCITAATAVSDGYDLGVVNGVSMILSKSHGYSPETISVFVSVMPIFVGLGALIGAYCSDTFGRKKVLIGSYVLLILGAVIMGIPSSFAVLLVGRAIVGLGIGIGGVVGSVYMAEIAPTKSRGSLVAQEAVFLSSGLLLGYLANYVFMGIENDYNVMLGVGAVLPFICLVTLLIVQDSLPESPYYERMQSDEPPHQMDVIREFFTSPGAASALMVGLLQPLCGIGPILYFSDMTFASIETSDSPDVIAVSSIWIGLTKNLVLVLSTFLLMDTVGRRTLLLSSSCLLVGTMAFVASVFQMEEANKSTLLLVGFCAAVGSYALGWNCVPSVYPSELLATRVRTFGLSFVTVLGRIVSVANSFLYPLFGLSNPAVWFYVFAGFNAVSFALVFTFAKETFNKPLIAKSKVSDAQSDSEREEILQHVDDGDKLK